MNNCVAEWCGVQGLLCIPLSFHLGKLLEFKYVNKDLDHGHCS